MAHANEAKLHSGRPRQARISVTLDEGEEPTTLHEVARLALECDDIPLSGSFFVIWSNYKIRGPFATFEMAQSFRDHNGIRTDRSTILDASELQLGTPMQRRTASRGRSGRRRVG